MKKLLSFALAILMTVSVFLPLSAFMTFAQSEISCSFYNDLPGSAYGEVRFVPDESGKFSLFWLDENGKKLTRKMNEKDISYTSIVDFDGKKGSAFTYTMHRSLAIPYGASKLGVFSSDKLVASCDIPKAKMLESDMDYAYAVISDLHYNSFTYQGMDASMYSLPRAYKFLNDIGIKNVFATGDLSTNADELAYQRYSADVASSGLTVLASGGNHEVVTGYDNMYTNPDKGYWFKYVNLEVYNGSLEGVCEIAPNKHDFTYKIPGNDNDVFILVCQARWDSFSAAQKPLIEMETLEWLSGQFEKYKDKTVHLFFHTYLGGDDETADDCEGDLTNAVDYGYKGFYNPNCEDGKDFRELLTKYKNVIWFNGHSHWAFEMQKYNENLNIYDYDGTTATMVHVPSVTAPRTVNDTDTSYTSHAGERSYGDLMFSGDGYEIMNGLDFVGGEIQSFACYIIYTDKSVSIVEGKCNDDTGYIYDKQFDSLRVFGNGNIPDYTSASLTPWHEYAGKVKQLYVSRGITSIGNYAFSGLTNLLRVEIKDTVSTIGSSAFSGASLMTSVIIPESVKTIGDSAFDSISEQTILNYTGTAEKYSKIEIAQGNDSLSKAKTSFGKVVVTWKIGDYVRSDDIAIGTSPEYIGVVALPVEDKDTCRPFTGWESGGTVYKKTLPKVNKNTIFTASFGESTDRYVTGNIGSNKFTKWSFDKYSGTLIISGAGSVGKFSSLEDRPWHKFADDIRVCIVKSGIQNVPNQCFARLANVTTVILEDGVSSMGQDSFAYMTNLTAMYIPSSVKTVSQGMAYNSNGLSTVYYSGTQEEWSVLSQKAGKLSYNDIFCGEPEGFVNYGVNAATKNKYTVEFVDEDGTVLKKYDNVLWGEGVIPPSADEIRAIEDKNGREFLGWDSTYFSVTDNMTVRAVYEGEADPSDTPAPETSGHVSQTTAPATIETDMPEKDTPYALYIITIVFSVVTISGVIITVIKTKNKKK